MNQPIIRDAMPSDYQALARLSGQLGYPSSEGDIAARLRSLSEEAGNVVRVADLEGKVVGWIHAFVAHRLESPPFVEIGGLVVDQHQRGQGIGGRLVAVAVRWAEGQGIAQVRVRSNLVREDTHRFYLQRGFSKLKSQIVFSLPIEPH